MLATALLLGAMSGAAACPTLAGAYICPREDGTIERLTIVEATGADGLRQYQLDGREFLLTDAANRPLPDEPTLRNRIYAATCMGDSELRVGMRADTYAAEERTGWFLYLYTYSLTKTGLSRRQEGEFQSGPIHATTVPVTTLCTRQ